MTRLAGVDIGGTKCAVVLGEVTAAGVEPVCKERFATPGTPGETLDRLVAALSGMLEAQDWPGVDAIGISCGGPLSSRLGRVLAPPNLPGWDDVDVLTPFERRFGVPVALQNDANACALAEWHWGAGRGSRSMVFLTFGTGMGAGLILDGRLYAGASDMAGEIGHVRIADEGPEWYGKTGAFEGFCSGGGIARLARQKTAEWLQDGRCPSYCASLDELDAVTAETVGRAASGGDPFAREIYEAVGRRLGQGLAVLVDVLNPERIVIGSIYARQRELLEGPAMEVLRRESLAIALSACKIVPAALGEQVGDYASLSVALQMLDAPETK